MGIGRNAAIVFLFAALGIAAVPRPSFGQMAVGISVRIGPPPLPVYTQPYCPGPGYLWVPGYWAWGPYGYYWVPGTWVLPPDPGLYWTPGYWGWNAGLYFWHPGYWGPGVGFYGGIDYGFGYFGVGYTGGYWRGRTFFYNRSVNRINVNIIHDTYSRNERYVTRNRVSFNGGPGGIAARPTRAQMAYGRQRHYEPTGTQLQHDRAASGIQGLRYSSNHGRPGIAATPRPGEFRGNRVEGAQSAGGPYRPEGRSSPQSTQFPQPEGRRNNNQFERGNVRSSSPRSQPRNNERSRPSDQRNPSRRAQPENRGPQHSQERSREQANQESKRGGRENNRGRGHGGPR